MKVFGKNVIYELLNSRHKVYELFLRSDVVEKDKHIRSLAKEKNLKITVYDKEKMNNVFKGLNQGYGAEIEEFKPYALEDVIDQNKKQLFIILDQLEDPNNLGAIIRSCDAFSVDGIIIPNKGNITLTDTVVKVSTGAIFYVPIIVVSNICNAIKKLQEKNIWVVGTDASAQMDLKDFKFDRNLAVVIGSEGFGMRDLVAKSCDYLVKIPMTGHVNSLNASVSAGIIISHLKTQS